jgi:ribonuclease BN (tRNA processing enzyme)
MPVSQKGREVFGGATSCYMVQAGEDCVFLDAGTGLLSAPTEFPRPPLILVTHLHLDHILGLGMYRRLVTRGAKTLLCLPGKDECEMRRQFDTLFSPPYWPLSPLNYEGELELVPARFPMRHGSLCIESAEGQHPGGSLIFRVSCGEKSLVYATDFEHERGLDALARFAEGTDLLLYDGQYSEEEYSRRRGFGHSTEEKGLEVMERCGAKRLLLIHHAPESTDRELQMREMRVLSHSACYAREGEVIEL